MCIRDSINGGTLARGGIQTGDIIISINGTTIKNYGDMLDATYYLTGEKPLTVEVIQMCIRDRGYDDLFNAWKSANPKARFFAWEMCIRDSDCCIRPIVKKL